MAAWLEELTAIDDGEKRRRRLDQCASTLPEDAPAQVHGAVLAALYSDFPRASRLAEVGREIAELRVDGPSKAFAARCEAHLSYIKGRHGEAASSYEEALQLFDQSGAELESARTLSSGLQTLILLGRYDQARSWAERAEVIFLKHGDVLRLARLDSNVGNIYFRQDQPREAIIRYERALEGFHLLGDGKDVAAALSNLAVCHTSLAHFPEALSYYQRAREVCGQNGLATLAAQADYNIAYLYYLRGDYRKAKNLYDSLRERCRANGDVYHASLCDLDEAELALELNLSREGDALARRAEEGFATLGMRYERAKSLVNLAIAASQAGDRRFADRTLRRASGLFEEEGNRVWPAMVALLRAVLAFHDQRFNAARKLTSSAWRVLSTTPMHARAAHCQILLARLWLKAGRPDRARAIGRAAVELLGQDTSPSLGFHSNLLEGEVNEMEGRWREALEAYEAARSEIETLRGRVDTEDLRISILKDKLAVYDALVWMCLESPVSEIAGGAERAALLVQQAKSRSLADRLKSSFDRTEPAEAQQYEALRKDLNWCYRQIEAAALLDQAGLSKDGAGDLRDRARSLESELLQLRPAAPMGPSLEPVDAVSRIQEKLPQESLIIEYFEARDVMYAFLIGRDTLEAVRLGPAAPARRMLRLLRFQLGKFCLGPEYAPASSLAATNHHLGELYQLLISPFEARLAQRQHLIIAPYRHFHGLPFAALNNGGSPLVERFTLSMAPSASVWAGCRSRARVHGSGTVVMAVPDARAPLIADEAKLVAEILPDARLYCGAEATLEAFRANSPGVRILHLATHGVFRRDNPLFSSIQLSDGRLNLIDLQQTDLAVELVTLSACNTGNSVTVGGDELLGLIRGFLSAGAQNLLVSLWEINDASTLELMRGFYTQVAAGAPLAKALREAMLELRTDHPHPFHWAPFVLVGDSGM